MGAFAVAGALFVTTGINAGGLDLRESSVTDLDHFVRSERDRVNVLQARVAELNEQISDLTASAGGSAVRDLQERIEEVRGPAGFTAVEGPGVTVTLTDAPASKVKEVQQTGEVPLDALVIHQQDIQAVVNALWAGGAEAISIQDVRVISTTGIKCVGNTVVLYDVPYSPPYVIKAIGDTEQLHASLADNEYVRGIVEGSLDYELGYEVTNSSLLELPAFTGTAAVQHAKRAGGDSTTTERS
jgi:uncharacterized protein YlxW (UPF0749 family)